MADFSGYQLTKKGLALQAKAQAGKALQYTKISVGDGVVPNGISIDSLTNLISLQMNLSPIAAEAVGDGSARVRATLSNEKLENGFILREIGVFANDPDEGEILYAYTTAGSSGDPIPAVGGTTAIERVVEAVIIVGQATNIQFQVKSGTYITIDELQKYTPLTQFQSQANEFQDHIKVNRVRRNSETVKVGDIRYPSVLSSASYLLLECTTAGTTGTVEPTWGTVGSTVTDGTAQWIVCDMRQKTPGGRVVTTADFTQSFAESGWTKLPNGLILQWGRAAAPVGVTSGNITVNFPVSFPNSCMVVIPIDIVTGAEIAIVGWDVSATTNSTVKFWWSGIPLSLFSYMVIGY